MIVPDSTDSMTYCLTLSPLKPVLCAECYGIQHIKTGFSGERVKGM